MEEYTTYGKPIMRNIRKILLEYKKINKLTNEQMSIRCDISLSEYDKIINTKSHSKYGCSVDTLYKICANLPLDANIVFLNIE